MAQPYTVGAEQAWGMVPHITFPGCQSLLDLCFKVLSCPNAIPHECVLERECVLSVYDAVTG